MKLISIIDKQKCSGCGACYSVCPVKAIKMQEDKEGFLYPVVKANCIKCGKCLKICQCNNPYQTMEPIHSWAIKAIDDKIRAKSSSGGVFSLLAQYVIDNGGHVCGAAFRSDCLSVHHIFDDIDKMRGSKYIQSNIGDSFLRAKGILDSGKPLLFSGVPCQIAGLKHYLEKDYDNLFCVQVICHGVPSEMVWRKYIAYESRGKTVSHIDFRDKRNGWQDYGVSLNVGKKERYSGIDINPYMLFFLRNYSLRPSCFECNAKNNCAHADITIGDFWGIEQVLPDWADNKGVSLVACHSPRGELLINMISSYIERKVVDFDKAIQKNPAYSASVEKPQLRDSFFKDIQVVPFKQLIRRYGKPKKRSFKQIVMRSRLLKAVFYFYKHRFVLK